MCHLYKKVHACMHACKACHVEKNKDICSYLTDQDKPSLCAELQLLFQLKLLQLQFLHLG